MNTRDKIIDAAIHQLITSGNKYFSQKKIAAKLGISPGNVTYHFPNRSDLINSVIDTWFMRWEAEFSATVGDSFGPDQLCTRKFIDWVMQSALTDENARMFRELWAMANHDPKLANSLHDLYSRAILTILNQLSLDESSEKIEEVKNLLYILACVSEGSTVVFCGENSNKERVSQLQNLVSDMLEPPLTSAIALTRSLPK